jgi:methionine sulfoxide reductase heme-binding subunit
MTMNTIPLIRLLEGSDRYRPLRWRVGGRRLADWAWMTGALAPAIGVSGALLLGLVGVLEPLDLAAALLAIGEDPGILILAIVLWCTPLTRITGRSYRRQRKWFGLSFAVCAVANLIAFLLKHPIADIDQDFVLIGLLAFVASVPLVATSTQRAITWMGTRRWQRLHRLTYLIAFAVSAHLWMVPQDGGPAGNLLVSGVFLVAAAVRIPRVAKWLNRQRTNLGGSLLSGRQWLRRWDSRTALPSAPRG